MPGKVVVIDKTKKPAKKKAGRPKKKASGPKKKVASRGWPKGKKRGKKRGPKPGRPKAAVAKKTTGGMPLITDGTADLAYWSEFVSYLNENTGKAFSINTDGKNFTLHSA